MISDLKARIPLGKKSKAQDEDFDDEEGDSSHQDDATDTGIQKMKAQKEDDSLISKLKSKIKGQKNNDDEEEDDDSEDSEAVAKKKRNSRIIQIAIGVGLVVFLASDYIFPPDEPTQPATSFKKPNREKKPVVTETTPTEATDPTAAVPTETPVETPTETPTDPSIAVAPTEQGTETTPAVDPSIPPTETPAPTESTQVDTLPSETVPTEALPTETTPTDVIATDPSTTPIEGTTPPDNSVVTAPEETTPTETAPTPDPTLGSKSTDTIDESGTTTDDDNLTDQILQDLEKQAKTTPKPEVKKEYVSPPDYEYRGRGLVYNCAGKHWACVDAPSYKTCEDNSSSVKYLKKKVECHPHNVYDSATGCEKVQYRMISSNTKTDFCQ